MFKQAYDQVKEIQNEHWFYNNRRFLLKQYLKRIDQDTKLKILDLGCATGSMFKCLKGFGQVVGLDRSKYALHQIEKDGTTLVQSDAAKLPFAAESFDLVILFGLLYHKDVTNESDILAQVYRVLKKGGSILITDSAFRHLYGIHDQAAQGVRRFNKKEIVKLLRQNNFKVVHFTYNYLLLFPLVWLKRKFFTRLVRSEQDLKLEFSRTNRIINWAISVLFNLEFVVSTFAPMPLGVTFCCWARK